MPLVTIQNKQNTKFFVPPPVAKHIAPKGTLSVNLTASEIEDPALTSLVTAGKIGLTVAENAALPANMQAATQEQVGSVTAFNATKKTTDATATTILTIPLATANTAGLVKVSVVAKNHTDAQKAAGYQRSGAFRNDSGTVVQVGSTASIATFEDTVAWDVTFAISGTNILVQVTGEALKTIQWSASANLQVVSAA